jgi:hypothetical protein
MKIHPVGAELFQVDTQRDRQGKAKFLFTILCKCLKITVIQLNICYKLGNCNIPVVVTETGIYQVQFSIIFQALHNHNFQISDTALNQLHTLTQSQLTAPAEWYKHSSQLVSSGIITVCSPTDPRQLAHKLRGD